MKSKLALSGFLAAVVSVALAIAIGYWAITPATRPVSGEDPGYLFVLTVLTLLSWLFGIIGLVLGSVGLFRSKPAYGLSAATIVLALLGLVMSLVARCAGAFLLGKYTPMT